MFQLITQPRTPNQPQSWAYASYDNIAYQTNLVPWKKTLLTDKLLKISNCHCQHADFSFWSYGNDLESVGRMIGENILAS